MEPSTEVQDLLSRARWLVKQPELPNDANKAFAPGWIGYGNVHKGNRILIATDSLQDPAIAQALAYALRERGATVDLICVDAGPDRDIEEVDEIRAMIRRTDWEGNLDYTPRRYNDIPWVTELMVKHGYDMIIQGRAYASLPCRWEGHPWNQKEQFLSEEMVFPRDLHQLINDKGWQVVREGAKGARVHVTDPEGTDITWTLFDEYWDTPEGFEVGWFGERPCINHLMYHPAPPLVPHADAEGVVAGTLAHFAKPYPLIQVQVERGRVEVIEGGGSYGNEWRALFEETKTYKYDQFPREGLFWLWEAAVGTNPKVRRPEKTRMLSTGGWEWERWRAGLLHTGFGTAGPSQCEADAGKNGIPYGHLHVHLQFPTVELIKPDGTVVRTLDHGHLAVLDDPEIRALASKYGDPDTVLGEDWVPPIPGLSVPGEYEVYARDPALWLDETGRLL
jgi:hypothetical protein